MSKGRKDVKSKNDKMYKGGFFIGLIILMISIFIKVYFNMRFSSYLPEFISIISMVGYLTFKIILSGEHEDTSKARRKASILFALIIDVFITAIISVRNYYLYRDKYLGIFDVNFVYSILGVFLMFVLITIILFWVFNHIAKRAQNKNKEV